MNRVTITAMGDDSAHAILLLTEEETVVAQKIVDAFEPDGNYAPTIKIEVKEIK